VPGQTWEQASVTHSEESASDGLQLMLYTLAAMETGGVDE